MIYIIASHSNRLEYVCRQIFNRWLDVEFEICQPNDFKADANDAVINYSNSITDNALNIAPCGLLHQQGITDVSPEWKEEHLFHLIQNRKEVLQ